MIQFPAQLVAWALGVVGAFIGSFLNVCILRMPAHRSIVFPGSACPACGTAIAPYHNVPILSWFLLRGRCAACAAPISARYPFVEALTAASFVAAWLRFGTGLALAHALVFTGAMIVLFFTDLDERILPDLVTLPGALAGLVFAFFRSVPRPFASSAELGAAAKGVGFSLATGIGAAGVLWLVGRLWRFVRPEIDTAMGLGDVKMIALVGTFLGARLTLLTVFFGSLIGTLIFVLTKLLVAIVPRPPADRRANPEAGTDGPLARGGRAAAAGRGPLAAMRGVLSSAGFLVEGRGAGMLDQIPFGSMLALGGMASLYWGERLVSVYLKSIGLSP